MATYSSMLLENAVEALSKLPGVGRKTALRLALHLLNEEHAETEQLCDALLKMKHNIMLCERCHNISDTKVCSICANPRRDENTLCVVADMRDVLAIENTASFNGLYHVLGGVISPIEGISPSDLKIEDLVQRRGRRTSARSSSPCPPPSKATPPTTISSSNSATSKARSASSPKASPWATHWNMSMRSRWEGRCSKEESLEGENGKRKTENG